MKGEIVKALKEFSSFVIACHIRPDGDTIGAALGLKRCLELEGKKVEIFNADPTPKFLHKLPGAEAIKVGKVPEEDFECLIFMETSDYERSGLPLFSSPFTIHIDHHKTSHRFANINWIDPSYSSVGEMVYELMKEGKFKIDRQAATCFYAAIFSDTGGFRFSNTTSRSLQYASELVELGANPSEVARLIYESHSRKEIELLVRVLSTLHFDETGKIASIVIFKKFLEELELSLQDLETESILNVPRSVEEVEVILLFKQLEEKKYRVSLRSKSRVDVRVIAESFGGGGHAQAAGFFLDMDYPEIRNFVYDKIKEINPWLKEQA